MKLDWNDDTGSRPTFSSIDIEAERPPNRLVGGAIRRLRRWLLRRGQADEENDGRRERAREHACGGDEEPLR